MYVMYIRALATKCLHDKENLRFVIPRIILFLHVGMNFVYRMTKMSGNCQAIIWRLLFAKPWVFEI